MRLHRRQFMHALTTLWATRFVGGCGRTAQSPTGAHNGLRHFVFFHARGGVDSILTTAPKMPNEVDEHVDLPYSPSDIVSVAGKPYGPHLRGLEKHLSDVAILNGVYTGSVQHDFGGIQINRMKQRTTPGAPTIGEVIGSHLANLNRTPLTSIALGTTDSEVGYPPGLLQCTLPELDPKVNDLCDDMFNMTPDQLQTVANGLDELALSSEVDPTITRSSRSIAALMRKLVGVPKAKEEEWLPEIPPSEISATTQRPRRAPIIRDCQRALWMLENELTTSVTILPRLLQWDTHTFNLDLQRKMSEAFFPVLARFLDELAIRRNSRGTLASQTLVVVASELGRSPRLNDRKGKDHLPEIPMLFWGPGVKTGDEVGPGARFGAVGRRMESLPINQTTGRESASGARPTLNDVGTTVLAAFRIEPRSYGYHGLPLPFLMEV